MLSPLRAHMQAQVAEQFAPNTSYTDKLEWLIVLC